MEFSKSNNGEIACLPEIEKNLQTIWKHKRLWIVRASLNKSARGLAVQISNHTTELWCQKQQDTDIKIETQTPGLG